MTRLGLVVALPREIPARFVRVAAHEGRGEGALPFHRQTVGIFHLIAVQSGIGSRRAAAASRLLVRRFTPQTLISFGFAGGLLPGLCPGTLIVGEQLVHEMASENMLWEADQALVGQFVLAARRAGLPVQQGRMMTTPHLVADTRAKVELARRSGACAVDMETAGVAEVAREAGLAWVAVRAVVDTAEEPLPVECLRIVNADGHLAIGPLMRSLWRSPRLVHDLFWLGRRTTMARRRLSRVLERWCQDQQPQGRRGEG